jgi:ferrous iron transport protein A
MTLISLVSLASIDLNKPALIRDLQGDSVIVSRLREIGFVRGEEVVARGRAPFGDPIMVELRGAIIALRKGEAACVKL